MSTRPVTGRVGFGGGGPPRRRVTPGSNGVSSVRLVRPSAPRVSAAYASLISAMRRVAIRDAAGSSPVRSGWLVRARRRQAALIWVGVARASTPRTSYGSRLGIPSECRAPTVDPTAAVSRVRLDSRAGVPSPTPVGTIRRAGIAAAAAMAPLGLAYRFALAYRVRAGYPRRTPPRITPADLGLPFESMLIESDGLPLPAWFIPARGGAPGPGVVLVHGWESARDRTLPMAVFLHAAGFHCLTFDVRGHGANPAETLPLSAGEFGADALAAFRALVERPEVTVGAIAGHSMGAIGALLAGAADPRVAAIVATSAPADPYRLTRQTFRLARLPIPDPIAYPLAWLTTRVYVRPRGHVVGRHQRRDGHRPLRRAGAARSTAARTSSCPPTHLERLAAAARAARAGDPVAADGRDAPGGRRPALLAVRGPGLSPSGRRVPRPARSAGRSTRRRAADLAEATDAARIPDGEAQFAAVEATPGGVRTLAQVVLPGATRPPQRDEWPEAPSPATPATPATPAAGS